MSHIAIERIPDNGKVFRSLMDDENAMTDQVRARAFELSNQTSGQALENWLKAEHELMLVPKAHLSQKNGVFDLQVAVPGFDAKNLRVQVMADAFIVRADATHKHLDNDGDVHFCELGEEMVFRRFNLPAAINADKVHAKLENGILTVTAAKLEVAPRTLTAGAAA